mmetsp:Transcript_67164/g.127951  ORF Transcript_67164/g.127951 Transcript_67164/m.127951 type:complete len:429 (-) Transcript_67164:99-1385(-)
MADGRQAVSGARSIGDDIMCCLVILRVVHTHYKSLDPTLAWCRDDHLLGTSVNVALCLLSIHKQTSRLNHILHAHASPRKCLGTFAACHDALDLVAVDDDHVFLLTNFHFVLEFPMRGIILHLVCKVLRIGGHIHNTNDIDLFAQQPLIADGLEHHAADTAKTIDAELDSHGHKPASSKRPTNHKPLGCTVLSQFYIRAFVRPIQMTVPDLSKEVIGECSICLADLADDDGQGVLRLFCNHTFHIDCIQHWLSKCDACPLCRSGVPTLRSCVHLKQKAIPSQSSPCVSDASTQEPPESIESFDIESSPADMESVDSVFCHMSQTPFPGSEFMENQQSDADSSHAAESQQMSIYGVLPDPPEEEPPAESRRKRKPPKPVRAQRREPEVSTMTATQSDVRRTHVQAAAANFDQIVQWSQEGVSSPDSESL